MSVSQPDDLVALAQRVPLTRLRPAKWNPRDIKSERFKNLCKSLERYPQLMAKRPILAMDDGTIYAGNQRYLAAMQLGWQTVWAVIEDVDDQTAKEWALIDNNNWGDWDEDALRELLPELERMGTDLTLLGFDEKALQDLMDDDNLPEPGDQKVEESPRLWGVIVTCVSETEQTELLERLQEEGRQVRALIA